MDWSDLAKRVISMGAPILGTALGGPLGGVAGEVLAKSLGIEASSPAEVRAALPAVDAAAISEAEKRWRELLQAETEMFRTAIVETNQSMRAEAASHDILQRWWRPVYAFELTLECAVLWTVIVHEFWTGDLQTINALVGATALLVTYWGFRFSVLGVYFSGLTRERVCAHTGQDTPGVIGQIVKAVTGKR